MPEITLSEIPTSAAAAFEKTKKSAATLTEVISPTFSSVIRASSSPQTPQNFDIGSLDGPSTNINRSSVRGFLRGRRPARGLLFPRGYYNR